MAIRSIREEGDEILKKKSKEVDIIDEKIISLINDMLETMYKYNGVGLAAVQVGILKRICVIDIDDGRPPLKLINPRILKEKGEQEVEEGCLSFPNKYAKKIKIVAKDLLAQAIAHEVDHLNGEVFIDKMLPGTLEIVTPDDTKNS